jgi:hypothetical protein
MFPIAMKLATQLGISPNIMSVAVMLGGSAGWILPYSYQCNLMVQAAGKYSTKDFIKVGVPLHVSDVALGGVGVLCAGGDSCFALLSFCLYDSGWCGGAVCRRGRVCCASWFSACISRTSCR